LPSQQRAASAAPPALKALKERQLVPKTPLIIDEPDLRDQAKANERIRRDREVFGAVTSRRKQVL
jgi:hypothetical protein